MRRELRLIAISFYGFQAEIWHALLVKKEQDNPQTWLADHGDYLYRYAMSRLHHEELSADMVQETLLAAWRSWNNFAGNSAIRTWLTGILKHKIIDHIRKEIRDRKLAKAIETDPTSAWFNNNGAWLEAPEAWRDSPENLCGNKQFQQQLQACINKLPDRQRLVFEMRELSGENTETICKQIEISSTNFHVLMHRARLALRSCLKHHWFGGERSS